jgi:hypothetical protein
MHVSSSGSLIMDKSGVKPIQWDMGYNSILKEPNYASQKKKNGAQNRYFASLHFRSHGTDETAHGW